jgi:hypothetical protein
MDNTSITFIGQHTAEALAAHADVVHAITRYCEMQPPSNISVYVTRRLAMEQIEWPIILRGSHGQRTVVAVQPKVGSIVKFSDPRNVNA